MKEESYEIEGTVVKQEKNDNFIIELENGRTVQCYLSGKLRKNNIRITKFDIVRVQLSIYDITRGRIVKRL